MFGIGVQEFALILVIALLVFGPKRLPELARMLGRGMGELRKASNDLRQSLALDDLQNDLRKDLKSARSMLDPDLTSAPRQSDAEQDHPPQAGDDLASNTDRPGAEPQPGELPPDPDHPHRPQPELEKDSEAMPSCDADTEQASRAETTAGDPPESDATDLKRG